MKWIPAIHSTPGPHCHGTLRRSVTATHHGGMSPANYSDGKAPRGVSSLMLILFLGVEVRKFLVSGLTVFFWGEGWSKVRNCETTEGAASAGSTPVWAKCPLVHFPSQGITGRARLRPATKRLNTCCSFMMTQVCPKTCEQKCQIYSGSGHSKKVQPPFGGTFFISGCTPTCNPNPPNQHGSCMPDVSGRSR